MVPSLRSHLYFSCFLLVFAFLPVTAQGQSHAALDISDYGFGQVGSTSFFRNHRLVLQSTDEHGHFTPFLSISGDVRLERVNAIAIKVIGNEEFLVVRTNYFFNHYHYRLDDYQDIFDDDSLASLFNDEASKSLADQLRSLGFVETETPGYFVRTLNPDTYYESKVLVVLEGETLVLTAQLTHSLFSQSTLTSVREPNSKDFDEKRVESGGKIFTFENDTVTFQMSNQGYYSPTVVGINRDLSDELEYNAFEPVEEQTGFIIGGVNATDTIRQLDYINGISIRQLESDMRPERMSDAGFLGKEESLLEVMAADNDLVLSSGFTHRQLADPLLYLRSIFRHFGIRSGFVIYNGIPIHIKVTQWLGSQGSPFRDRTGASIDIVAINLLDGRRLGYSPLLGDMALRYGFYEGHGTPYRVEPSEIIQTFGLASDYDQWLERDSIARLLANEDVSVTIDTAEEFRRMANLVSLGADLFERRGYKVVVGDLETFMTVYGFLANSKNPPETLASRIEIRPTGEKSDLPLRDQYRFSAAYAVLTPAERKQVEGMVSKVTIPDDESVWSFSYFLEGLVQDDTYSDGERFMVSRLDVDKNNYAFITHALRKASESAKGTDANKLVQAFDGTLPGFRTTWLAELLPIKEVLNLAGVSLDENTPLPNLLEQASLIQRIQSSFDYALKTARNEGEREVSETDMIAFYRFIYQIYNGEIEYDSDSKTIALTEEHKALLARLGVNAKEIAPAMEITSPDRIATVVVQKLLRGRF